MKFFLPFVVVLLLSGSTYGQGKSRTAFGLHQQFVQKRAIKGYKTNSAFRWKAQKNPGLVGATHSNGYWQGDRYYSRQQPAQPKYYQQPAQTYVQPAPTYQQPIQTYAQPVQTYSQPVQTYVQPVQAQPAAIYQYQPPVQPYQNQRW